MYIQLGINIVSYIVSYRLGYRLGQADAGDNEAKLMTKLEWVRTSDPVIRSPARYRWTTAPAPAETIYIHA